MKINIEIPDPTPDDKAAGWEINTSFLEDICIKAHEANKYNVDPYQLEQIEEILLALKAFEVDHEIKEL